MRSPGHLPVFPLLRAACGVLFWVSGCAGGPEAVSPSSNSIIPSPPVPRAVAEEMTRQYPDDQYLLGLGLAPTPQVALDHARADLAEQIRVRVSTLARDHVRIQGGRTEEEISRVIVTRANELMAGVKLAAHGMNEEDDLAYAIMVLPQARIQRARTLTDQIDRPGSLSGPERAMSEPIWVTSEGVVTLGAGTTVAEAAYRSREKARRQAIEEATGAFVSAQRVVYNAEVAEDLIRSRVRGIVIDEEILEEGVRKVRDGAGTTALLYATKLRAQVKPLPWSNPEEMAVDVALNRTVFHEGDEVQVTVVSSRDVYVYVFTIAQDDGITLLFPNRYARDNFLVAEQRLVFPSDAQRRMGIHLRTTLPDGEPKAIERVKVLAIAQQLPMSENRTGEDLVALGAGEENPMLVDLMRHMASLDDVAWTEETIPYEIRR